MAVVWMDNWKLYGYDAAKLFNGSYASGGNIGVGGDPDPTVVAGATVQCGRPDAALRKVLQSAQATVGLAQRIWQSVLGGTDAANFQDANQAVLTRIYIDGNGRISARRGDGTVLGTTAAPVIVANAWQHVESKVVISTTVGSVEVRVEGVVVLNLTNVNTQGANLATVQNVLIATNASFATTYYKDLIIWDGTDTINNNFVGTCQVIQLMPNADISNGWTVVGAASPYQAIDELNPNDNTDYIQAGFGPFPAPCVVGLENLPPTVTSVRALMIVARSQKIDGGDGNLQTGLISGGSTALGTDRPITSAYTYWSDVIQRDPATAAAWTPPAVNAANLQINRTV